MSEHYFTASPTSPTDHRTVTVRLAGRDVTVAVASGVFASHGLDKGTAILLDRVPDPPATGDFLDLGCGWGAIALTLGLLSPAASVWAVDVNERALELTRANATALGLTRLHASRPDGIPAEIEFDLIWSNPPIRIGKQALHTVLLDWLPRLRPEGVAQLVVQKHLGSDSLATWLTEQGYAVTRLASSKGFRVLTVRRAA